MIALAFLALIFGAFCLLFSAYDHVARRGKGDRLDMTIDVIFAVGGLTTFATALAHLLQ